MQLKFISDSKQFAVKKGALIILGNASWFRGAHHEKLLPPQVPELFREALKNGKFGHTPTALSSLTGLTAPSKVVLGILPEKVAKDNSPTRREWIYQLLEAIESEEHATIIVCLDKPEHIPAAVSAAARRLRLVNYRKVAKTRNITFGALAPDGHFHPIEAHVKTLAEQVAWTCRMVDTAPNHLTSSVFSKEIQSLFKDVSGVSTKELVGERLLKEGLHGIYNVGKAAVEAPRMLILDYKPKAAKKTVVLAGKGVCFDTGGLSLKGGANMVGMKSDMGGAAAVVGAFSMLVQAQVPHRIIACLGLVENAIGPNAYRNDDVIVMHSGKSVEVNNTDAEGRLVLSDCLSYCARTYKPQLLIDAATLTGAQMVATGLLHAAVISNREELDRLAIKIGKETGDLVVPLPFAPELYQAEFKSQVADMVNSVKNRSNAQTSCAAQFIYSHIDDLNIPWIHIDLAGPSTTAAGLGTGYGVQLITGLAREFV